MEILFVYFQQSWIHTRDGSSMEKNFVETTVYIPPVLYYGYVLALHMHSPLASFSCKRLPLA